MRISDWSSDVCSSDLRLAKRSLGGGIRIVGGLMVLAAAFAIATVTVPSWTLALVFTGCFNFLNHTYYGATFATYMTLAPVHMRGVLAAIFAVALTMIGYGFGPDRKSTRLNSRP